MANHFSGFTDGGGVLTSMKVKDAEYVDASVNYRQFGKDLNDLVNDYIRALQSLDRLQGTAADNIRNFAALAVTYMQNSYDGITQGLAANMANYITELDEADTKMY